MRRTRQLRLAPVDAWKARDWKAQALAFMVRRRSRLPGWHEEALGVLATAEGEGVRVLEAALPAVSDPKLRNLFAKHIEDEKRHTRGFTELFREYFPGRELPTPSRPQIRTNVLDFFAFLELTEVRGEQMIQNYYDLYDAYPKVQAFMATVLKDERYHANYLHAQLETWAKQGRAEEVATARRVAAHIDTQGFFGQLLSFIRIAPRLLINAWWPRARTVPADTE